MVGIVLVAHSRALAEALVELTRRVTAVDLNITIAAGAGEQHADFGTDAVEIAAAIQQVASDDGVVVLMDLGSAILSAEMALEFLPPEIREHVRLCPAPLVEGAIAAAVQAGLGSDLDRVCREAREALLAKIEHIGGETKPEQPQASTTPAQSSASMVLKLQNAHGLHVRPAAQFVRLASTFDAAIHVSNQTTGKGPVSAHSLNALATLGIEQGHEMAITASGKDAEKALAALQRLVQSRFGEDSPPSRDAHKPVAPVMEEQASSPGCIQGVAVSPGVALGRLHFYQPAAPEVSASSTENPQLEWQQLQKALEDTRLSIQQRRKKLSTSLGESKAALFDAHDLLLQDPELLEEVKRKIFQQSQSAAYAWQQSIVETASRYTELQDEYLQARRLDVLDVGNQVLLALTGASEMLSFPQPGEVILASEEFTPSQAAQLNRQQVLGLAASVGAPTSHSAIIARSLGLPVVSGLDAGLLRDQSGQFVALDGFEGRFWIEPDAVTRQALDRKRQAWLEERQALLAGSHLPVILSDGKPIQVAANVGSPAAARAAAENGADGIGVLRTEFLYLNRQTAPDEEEQIRSMEEVAAPLAGKTIIVRTLDVGGDKPLPYIQLPSEANPFLGLRAIRLSLRYPELFLLQVRAILQVGVRHEVNILLPMIANLEEILQARALINQAHQELQQQKTSHRWPIQVGIMIEIPSAALLSSKLADQVDFFSVGTNDLTQYTLAAERGNPELEDYLDALHPAVLLQIKQVAQAAHQSGKWAGVCGEISGDPLAAPILVGLGVDELSMNPADIPAVKACLRQLDIIAAQALAEAALQCSSAAQVRLMAEEFSRQASSPA